MTLGELVAVGGAVVIAVAMWVFMFRVDRRNIWPRTWVAAAVLSGYAIVASVALGAGRSLVRHISLVEVLIGLMAGAAWIIATQLGAAVIGRVVPSFVAEVSDLYTLAEGDTVVTIAAPITAMAVAEEFLFRGLIQARAGLLIAVVIYAAVQVVEKKAALVLAALLGGLLWGELFVWRRSLVAPMVAHAAWTLTLTLIWPIRPPRTRVGAQLIAHST